MRKVVVLMGGESQEREVSRVTGTAVAKALAERGWDVALLDTGEGLREIEESDDPRIGAEPPSSEVKAPVPTGPQAVSHLARSLDSADIVFIALHGGWGEDGTIQAFFEMLGMPYTGSGVLASALAMDKERAKQVMRANGIPVPDGELVVCPAGREPEAEVLERVRARFPGRVVVKPNAEGSTVGLSILDAGAPLREAVMSAARFGERVLVEDFIPGRELTVAVLAGRALPVVEIVPEGGLYTYEAKYTKGKSRYEVPADLPGDLAARLSESAVATYHALGCEGFARVDYRLREDGRFHCLEANTIPGMTPLSLVPMAAKAAGVGFGELIEQILEMGLARGTRRGRRPAESGVEG